jgi:hypothetical protein
MAQRAGYKETFKVITAKLLAEVKPGGWYFGLNCLACKDRFAVFDDASGGLKEFSITGVTAVRVACPHCAADRLYPIPSDFVRFQVEK